MIDPICNCCVTLTGPYQDRGCGHIRCMQWQSARRGACDSTISALFLLEIAKLNANPAGARGHTGSGPCPRGRGGCDAPPVPTIHLDRASRRESLPGRLSRSGARALSGRLVRCHGPPARALDRRLVDPAGVRRGRPCEGSNRQRVAAASNGRLRWPHRPERSVPCRCTASPQAAAASRSRLWWLDRPGRSVPVRGAASPLATAVIDRELRSDPTSSVHEQSMAQYTTREPTDDRVPCIANGYGPVPPGRAFAPREAPIVRPSPAAMSHLLSRSCAAGRLRGPRQRARRGLRRGRRSGSSRGETDRRTTRGGSRHVHCAPRRGQPRGEPLDRRATGTSRPATIARAPRSCPRSAA